MKNTSDIRVEQATAVKTFGVRMRQARELCNLSQLVAAQRLGYSNSSKLSKVEGATSTTSVPMWLIVRASRVYKVSIDYLMGQTDDSEIGMRVTFDQEASSWLFDQFHKASLREMKVLWELHRKVEMLEGGLNQMQGAAGKVNAALERFQELNPSFETDMRGGARLVEAVEDVRLSSNEMQSRMKKLNMEYAIASGARPSQLSLL